MADSLLFETSELEILETIDFEEEIQRPESLRFFTLEDQLVDFFEKSLPAGKPTTFQKRHLQNMQQRIKKLYGQNITFSDSDYVLDTNRKTVDTTWIHDVYAPFEYKAYNLTKSYVPLFDKNSKVTPNYYPRLIAALPRTYSSTGEGRQLTKKSVLVNEEGKAPVIGLGNFVKNKTVINDDGTYDVAQEEVAHTGDDLKIKGYFLDAKPFDIPNPMQDHPFLKSSASGYIDSDIPLLSMYPTIESILEHAVPVTKDPYTEGKKYLDFYDVSISDVPWRVWKQRFPPVESKEMPLNVAPLVFPNKQEDEPSNILIKTYNNPRVIGEHSRYWLTRQIDGGDFVSKLLISSSSEHGVISTPPSIQPPEPDYPVVHSDVCANLTNDFDSFLSAGLYRNTKFDKGGIPLEGVCVPVGKIQQEKLKHVSSKKLWKETEENSIKTNYLRLLASFQQVVKESHTTYEKPKTVEESERRKDVLNILEDSERSPDDKVRAIEILLRDTQLNDNQYYDVDSRFVVCMHTLEILRGKMEEDAYSFFKDWTMTYEGSRVCRYCSEEVSDLVVVATDDYDEDGYLVKSNEKLEGNVDSSSTPNSFLQIRHLFDLKTGGESLMFLTLSLLQTLPQETQVLPVLHLIRKITASLKARATQKSMSKKDQDRVEGVLGLCGTILILQIHTPFLVPKRSVKLSGYPRDTEDSNDSPILDSILTLLKRTFDEFPVMLDGSIRSIAGDILARGKKVREESIRYFPVFIKEFKTLLENARERYTLPAEEINANSVKFPIMRVENPIFGTSDVIGDESVTECNQQSLTAQWISKLQPTLIQKPLKLIRIQETTRIEISKKLEKIVVSIVDKKEVASNISKGVPSGFPVISEFIKSSNDFCSFVTASMRILDLISKTTFSKEKQASFRRELVSMTSQESSSILRDAAKGILIKVLHEIKGSPELVRIVNNYAKSDLTLRMLFTSKEAAEKEAFKLREQEKNLVKSRYREMNDTQREIVKLLVDIGQSEFIVTNVDREIFAKQFERENLEENLDVDKPEEGYDDVRDYVENGDLPQAANGVELDVDRGNYGDRAVRDYNDYGNINAFDE
jgi:hypothetical protein